MSRGLGDVYKRQDHGDGIHGGHGDHDDVGDVCGDGNDVDLKQTQKVL